MTPLTGRRIPRRGDQRLVTGGGRYIDDIALPEMLHLVFVRTPHAHARIVRIDTAAARARKGAALVLTGDDLPGKISPFWTGHRSGPWRHGQVWPLARGRVRVVGEPVAAVVAASRYLAEDIADMIEVEYAPLPAVTDAGDAMAPDAPLLYDEWPDNRYGALEFATPGLDEAFHSAACVVKRTFTTGRHSAVPLEGRGCIADYSSGNGRLTLHVGSQDVHMARQVLSGLLGMEPGRLRVVSPDVGGGFGAKMPVYREEMVACVASRLLGRPVKWIQDRREGLLGDAHARETTVEAEMAFDAQGRILGLRSRILSDAGAYPLAGRGPSPEGVMIANEMPGPYRVPQYGYRLDIVMTNKAPVGICRGVGGPVATFVVESLLNMATGQLAIDPVTIRRRNLVDRFPHTTPTGFVYDSGDYQGLLDRLLEAARYDDLLREVRDWRAEGRLVGIGLCVMNEGTTRSGVYGPLGMPISSQEGCHLQMGPTGHLLARFGTTTQGQGLETTLAAVLADILAIGPEQITVEMGDTETAPYGGGVWGSRGGTAASAAATLAARRLRRKLETIAAHCLKAEAEELEWVGGAVRARGSGERMTYAQIAEFAYFRSSELPREIEPGLAVISHWEPELRATFSAAAHLAVVEVDRRTAAARILRWVVVEDCGTILNAGLVDGQVQGALAQGIGMAALEHLVYDRSGQLITASFMDYLLPTVHEVPEAEIHHVQTPSAHNPTGARGVGEAGTVGAPATYAAAVSEALNAEILSLPVTPQMIFQLLYPQRG